MNIEELVNRKRFRLDLFHRINTITITLPPLRDKKDDIPLLINHFLAKYSHIKTPDTERITPNALALLQGYPWPGNVRELENEIKRICALYSDTKQIDESMISETIKNHTALIAPLNDNLKEQTDNFQRNFIRQTLIKCNGRLYQTAKLLGYDRANLKRKMKQLNIRITNDITKK
jgi:DNA-binding NtrC family response regulator